ncbi:MAG: 2Fe-2S iron-sulfur cluster-binding protein [Chloroherpetonaceae bacterium]|nr:2Fe-2S iron-sulfur cluster-binding protein [Chthonomonadaceae bacterium]MDW8208553.1 2Fe-2S iron-sulfur cluster-binding protein [Chloroherpetonaceae bacterium]
MVTLTIDDISVTVSEGSTVLEAARAAGIAIPTLCHLPGRAPRPSCYVCMVRVNGGSRLMPACATPVVDGMRVESQSESVLAVRRTAIELLLSEHLGDCVGPCEGVCPAHLETPRMMRQIATGQFREALITVKRSIALPATLGRICPELCEKGCRRAGHDGPVAVCLLKRFVADHDLASGDPYIPPCAPSTGKRVAIIGSGPAGLSAAYYLLQQGHACTLFDAHALPGGMLRYGVPEELLPRDVLDAEIRVILQMGAEFRGNVRIGAELSLDQLRAEYHAVLLATGALQEREFLEAGLARSAQGVRVDRRTMQTSLPGVFAAGSVVIASRHAVRAVADGRAAAEAIGHYLAGVAPSRTGKEFSVHAGRLEPEELRPYLACGSPEPRLIPSGGRAAGFTPEEAQREAQRCLQCACARADTCALRDIAERLGANPTRFRGTRRAFEVDTSHPEVRFEPGKCIACGICVRIAAEQGETLGLGMQGRGFGLHPAVPFRESLKAGLRTAARACAAACPTGALVLVSDRG